MKPLIQWIPSGRRQLTVRVDGLYFFNVSWPLVAFHHISLPLWGLFVIIKIMTLLGRLSY